MTINDESFKFWEETGFLDNLREPYEFACICEGTASYVLGKIGRNVLVEKIMHPHEISDRIANLSFAFLRRIHTNSDKSFNYKHAIRWFNEEFNKPENLSLFYEHSGIDWEAEITFSVSEKYLEILNN